MQTIQEITEVMLEAGFTGPEPGNDNCSLFKSTISNIVVRISNHYIGWSAQCEPALFMVTEFRSSKFANGFFLLMYKNGEHVGNIYNQPKQL